MKSFIIYMMGFTKTNKAQLTIDFLISVVIFSIAFVFAFQLAFSFVSSNTSPHEITQTTNEKITEELVYDKMERGENFNYLEDNNITQIRNDLRIDDYNNVINSSVEVENEEGEVILEKGRTPSEFRKKSERTIYSEGNYKKIRVISW